MRIIEHGSNYVVVDLGGNVVLFSYNTPVAGHIGGEFCRTSEHHSKTTSKHINQWLEGRKAVEKPQAFFDDLAKGRA